jgi:hypothetical protein
LQSNFVKLESKLEPAKSRFGTQAFPAGQSALWKYKAIDRADDQRVGQWRDVASVAAAG